MRPPYRCAAAPQQQELRTYHAHTQDMFAPFRDDARTAAMNRLAVAIEKLVDHLGKGSR